MEKVKVIANYLPQFHETKENNKWWGQGYSDWVAVRNCKPIFDGHKQPKVPKLGYYDLSKHEDIKMQSELAKKYGIYGFGIYHYWFSSKLQLLTKPAEIILKNDDININYMFIWDNGTWKRTWSNISSRKGGKFTNDWAPLYEQGNIIENDGVLAELQYGGTDEWVKHFNFLLPYFKDSRYIKIDNKPLFGIFHQDNKCKILKKMIALWNDLALQNGFNGVYIIGQTNVHGSKCSDVEFDYQPPRAGWANKSFLDRIINRLTDRNKKLKYDYDAVWMNILKNARRDSKKNVLYGAFVSYDDSPRRGNKGKIVIGSTPEKFGKYMVELLKISKEKNKEFIFLTAWNEWGEGAYLEPDEENGYAYLEALKEAIDEVK